MLLLNSFSNRCIIIGGLAFAFSHPTQADPVRDKASASLSASEFCQKIGQAVTVPTAADASPNQFHISKDAVRNLRWQIQFPNQADVEVDGASGNITHYMNSAFFHRKRDQAENKTMAREQAILRATEVLKATGVSISELSLEATNELHSPGSSNQAQDTGGQWNIIWKRVYQGIPYYQDSAIVELQGATGEVIGLGVNFHSSPTSPIENQIGKEQAISIAQEQLAAAELADLPLKGAVALILQPNSFWQDGNERPTIDMSRPEWFCSFGQGEQFYAVWVDMQTGDVIGGTTGGTLGAGSGKWQKPLFGHQLKHPNLKKKSKPRRSH